MWLSQHVHGLSQEYLINRFISKLRDLVTYEAMSKRPHSMSEAMRLVKLKEDKITALLKNLKGNFARAINSNPGGTTASQGGTSGIKTTITTNNVMPTSMKKLSYQKRKGTMF